MAKSTDENKTSSEPNIEANNQAHIKADIEAGAEQPEAKLTPLEAIRQAQAARQYNANGGGKRGGNKGQPFGQGGAAASRKPTTGRRSIGGA